MAKRRKHRKPEYREQYREPWRTVLVLGPQQNGPVPGNGDAVLVLRNGVVEGTRMIIEEIDIV